MIDAGKPTRLICAITSSSPEAMCADIRRGVSAGAEAVECRIDMLDRPPGVEDLRAMVAAAGAAAEVIVTYRPVRQGGRFDGDESARLKTLASALEAGAACIDVEMDVPPGERPAGDVILSHHDFDRCPADLDAIVASMDASAAAVNKVAFTAAGPEDALRAVDVIRACRKPTIASAMGEAGFCSRVLAKKFGAFGVFASLAGPAASAAGQMTVDEIRQTYRWDAIGPDTAVCGVIGCPVGHSMSPAIHNAAFAATGVDAVYVPLLIQPGDGPFNRFLDAVLERPWLDWRGLSVTIPHKENALAYVGAEHCDPLAERIGAVNTITIAPGGSLRGDNTDYAAAIDALCGAMGMARADLDSRRVAVLGAGGAARAIVAALAHYGADVTIYNRTVSRAEQLAAEFSVAFAGRDRLDTIDAEILINCTPIGMHPHVDSTPIAELPSCLKVVFDTIYNPIETCLIRQARQAGCRTVTGVDMFVHQAAAQFEGWTNRPAPTDVMRQVVLARLGG